MDGADDDFRGPPLPPGQLQRQDPGTPQQRPRLPFQVASPSQHQRMNQRVDGQVTGPPIRSLGGIDREMEIAIMREQLTFQHELQIRRQMMREQHEQIMAELESQYQHLVHQANQSPIPANILQQQQALSLPEFHPPAGRRVLPEEQIYFQRAVIQQQRAILQQRQLEAELRRSKMNNSLPQDTSLPKKQRSSSMNSIETSESSTKKAGNGSSIKRKPRSQSLTQPKSKEAAKDPPAKDSVVLDETKNIPALKSVAIEPKDEKKKSPEVAPKIKKDISLLLLAAEEFQEENAISSDPPSVSPSERGMDILAATATDGLPTNKSNADPTSNGDFQLSTEVAAIIANLRINHTESVKLLSNDDVDVELEKQEEIVPGFLSSLPKLPAEPEYIDRDGDDWSEEEDENENGDKHTIDLENSPSPSFQPGQILARPNGLLLPGSEERDVTEPVILKVVKENQPTLATYHSPIDTWWPSNRTIKRERRLQGYQSDDEKSNNHFQTSSTSNGSSLHVRMSTHVEPGVLQKLPHCRIYPVYFEEQKGVPPPEPLFCCQVTETYCMEIMVCCSICSTWRHVACGGHFTRCLPQSQDSFTPICDFCYEEKSIIEKYPMAKPRIARQRTEHLRRAQSTTAVMKQIAYAKHGGTYKWPLGSVSATHIGGHTRSVHARHERAEKQWGEMAAKLGNGLGYRPKERVKVRTREFERLAVNLEDAEGQTDRHNMVLFLQNDTAKENPTGFEKSRHNFFDPAEDEHVLNGEYEQEYPKKLMHLSRKKQKLSTKRELQGDKEFSKRQKSLSDQNTFDSQESFSPNSESGSPEKNVSHSDDGSCVPPLDEDESLESKASSSETRNDQVDLKVLYIPEVQIEQEANPSTDKDEPSKKKSAKNFPRCLRKGCNRRPRFDSTFCSDSCGVSALESDLLCSLQYASDMHPFQLRP